MLIMNEWKNQFPSNVLYDEFQVDVWHQYVRGVVKKWQYFLNINRWSCVYPESPEP